jgi:hypothetical protein
MNANDRFDAAREAVMQLDLSAIKTKLMHVASGEGWSLEKTNAVEQEYRRFLCLMTNFPDEAITPLADVDTFWHYHILDTMKYAADCQQAFGYFLHHYPYVGLRGEDDEQLRIDSGERTRQLYEAMFGEPMTMSADETPAVAATLAGTWCAGPAAGVAAPSGTGAAWCAGPGAKIVAKSGADAAAWCAGPAARHTAGREAGMRA